MGASAVAYSTWTGKAPEDEVLEDEGCLGSQGVISTTQCNNVSLMVHGVECPVCIL